MNRHKTAALAALAFGVLYAAGIFWGMPSEFVSEIDSEFPSGPFNVLAHMGDNGYLSNYPVFHKLLVLPLYMAIIVIFKMIGQLSSFGTTWPYGFSDPAAALTAMIIAARSVSLLMGAGTIFVLGLLIGRMSFNLSSLKDRLLVFSPVAAFGLSGVFAYYSRVSNYDVPQLFWWSLSLYYLWKCLAEKACGRKELVLSALFSALAVATKDQAFFFIAGSSLLFFTMPQNGKSAGWRLRKFFFFFFCAAVFYCAAAVLVQPFHWVNHLRQVLFLNITSGQFAVFDNSLSGHLGLFTEVLRCLSHIISPFGVLIGIAGLAVLVMKRQWSVAAFICFPALAAYLLIFARIHFVFERYLLNDAFLSCLAAAGGIRLILDTDSAGRPKAFRRTAAALLGCWLLYQCAFSFTPVTYAQAVDTKRKLSAVLPSFVPGGDTIGWQGSRFSLPNADCYARYRLEVPDQVFKPLNASRMGRVFVPGGKKRTLVLSDRDLFSVDSSLPAAVRAGWIDTSGLVLMAKVEDPPFVRNNIKVYAVAHRLMTFRVSIPYFIYKRNYRGIARSFLGNVFCYGQLPGFFPSAAINRPATPEEYGVTEPRPDGHDRQPVQTARLHLSIERDLRRP